MKLIEKSENKIAFVADMNESIANALRRSCNEIPIVAIDEVEFHKNDSALYDEIIAHRIGLIPIKETRKLEVMKEGDKPSAKNEVKLSLKVKGPGMVYSGDLKGDADILYDKMPIVLLGKDQELELVAFGKIGKGVNHAKYSPGLVYYRNVSEIHVKNAGKAQEIINKLGDSIINKPKASIKNNEVYQCSKDIEFIETLSDDLSSVELKHGNEIVFFIESWGQREPKEIFNEAVKSLDHNLKELLKAVK